MFTMHTYMLQPDLGMTTVWSW